jgi:hypothetical protein
MTGCVRRVAALALGTLLASACGFQLGGVLGSALDESRDTDDLDEVTTGPAWTGGGGDASTGAPDPTGAGSSGENEPDGTSTTSGGEPPRGSEDCCSAHASTGCLDPAIQACVCEVDPACCDDGWDELCVHEVDELGCGACVLDPMDVPTSSCCGDTKMPGCGDAAVEACLCDVDAYCCLVQWDESCAAKAMELGCSSCDAGANAVTDCCTPHPSASCDDATVAECVCNGGDEHCCEEAWDELCVEEVQTFGCGVCAGEDDGGVDPLAPSDCCVAANVPSCGDPDVTECVCEYDAYCCQIAWDGVCVDAVDASGCGSCTPPPGGTDGGGSESSGTG